MSRVVAGTLLLPNGQAMANASIYFTAKRTEAVSIIEGSNTFFTTNNAGVYNQTVVNGWYAVSIEYIADSSGAHTRRWQLGDVFIEDGAASTLEALIIASNPPDDLALGVFYQILEEAQEAAESAQASAAAAAASAASITVGTGPTNIPNTTILNTRLGTTGNLGNAAQATLTTSNVDATPGRVLRAGNGGWLGNSPAAADLNTVPHGTSSFVGPTTLNIPAGEQYGVTLSLGAGLDVVQIFSSVLNDRIFSRRSAASVGFSSWVRVLTQGAGLVDSAYTTGTAPSAAANNKMCIIVTNASGGERAFWSDGTNWLDANRVILS